MKKTVMLALVFMATSHVFAKEVQCPTAENLKKEWQIGQIGHIEGSKTAITYHQSLHRYGTDRNWLVDVTIDTTNIDVYRQAEYALMMATYAIEDAKFDHGGRNQYGSYTCVYKSDFSQTIYAFANR